MIYWQDLGGEEFILLLPIIENNSDFILDAIIIDLSVSIWISSTSKTNYVLDVLISQLILRFINKRHMRELVLKDSK